MVQMKEMLSLVQMNACLSEQKFDLKFWEEYIEIQRNSSENFRKYCQQIQTLFFSNLWGMRATFGYGSHLK